MTHLIFTSVPLEEIPEPDHTSFVKAVENCGLNNTGSGTEPLPSLMTQEVVDNKGRKCLEWGRIYRKILQRPKPIGHCDLLSYASATTPWFAYIKRVSVCTDIPFRKNNVTRYDIYDGELDCRITEEQRDGLNCLSLYLVKKAKTTFDWQVRLGMLNDRIVPFLEMAAIYHLANQALKLSYGMPGNPTTIAMCKKLTHIMRICNLQEFDPRMHHQDQDE